MFSSSTHHFLTRFFSQPNLLDWSKISTGAFGDKFKPYLSRLEGDTPSFTVLPYMERDKTFTWFALAFDEASFVQLRELIRSFIGPTYSRMNFYRTDDIKHNQDANAQTFTGGYYFKFRGNDDVIGKKVQIMFRLLAERPKRTISVPKAPGPLLRNFDLALQAGDFEMAEAQIANLIRYHLIDPRNALFMQIEMLTRFERWDSILKHHQMEDLLKASRPARVTEGIIRAVYAVHLLSLESNTRKIQDEFEEVVWPQYQSLFRVRGSLSHPHVLVCFLLRSMMKGHPLPALREEILAVGSGKPVEALLRSLAMVDEGARQDIQSHAITLEEVKELADQSRFDEAFAAAVQLDLSKEQIQLVLTCAYEIQDLAVDKQAIEVISRWTETDLSSILTTRHLKTCYEYLQPTTEKKFDSNLVSAAAPIPGTWNEWFEQLDSFDPNQAIVLARRGAMEWPREGFVDNSIEMESFISHLQKNIVTSQKILSQSIVHILRYFVEDPFWPRTELKKVYAELHRLFLLIMQGAQEEMKIATDWSQSLISMGLAPPEYTRFMKDLNQAWCKFTSKEFLNVLLPFLREVAIRPCPDPLSRLRFIYQIQSFVSKGQRSYEDPMWQEIELNTIPRDWATWLNLLYYAEDDFYFLADLCEQLILDDSSWTPIIIQRINDWFTNWIIEEPEPAKRSLIARALPSFISHVVRYRNFPAIEEIEFYETLADAVRMYAGKNEQILQDLIILMDGLLLQKPDAADRQWRYMREWMTLSPILRLLSSVFDWMELFYDYGVPGMEIKPVWDEWVGELHDKLDNGLVTLRPLLLTLGEEIAGDFYLLRQLQEKIESSKQGVGDPIAELPDMTITIFSCREKAANRAADQIMKRNSRIKVNVCTSDRATDQTTAYARNSDLSIVVTACISHALTYGIKDHLAYEPIYPRSSGEAGIIARLEEYALGLTAS